MSDRDDGSTNVVYGLILIVAGYIIGFVACACMSTAKFHREAIEHGAAYYHPETGEFTWKGEAQPSI